MNALKTPAFRNGMIALVWIGLFLPAVTPAQKKRQEGTTKNLVQNLLQQGISPQQIIDVDAQGIPLVCGNPAPSVPATKQAIPNAIPAGTRSWEAIPGVIRNDGIETFRLEVNTNGPVAGVIIYDLPWNLISPESPPFNLRDDGLGEDRVAGDDVFTGGPFRYNGPIIPEHYLNNPNSPAGLGTLPIFLKIEELSGEETGFLNSPAVGVLQADISAITPVALSPDIAVSPHLINIRSNTRGAQNFLRQHGSALPDLTRRIYDVLPDVFDFFMFFSTDKIEHIPSKSSVNFVVGRHTKVQRNYTGTGRNTFDSSQYYGSNGRLLSCNVLDTYTRGIYSNNAVHEITHQWGAAISSSLGLIDESGAHYRSRSSVASTIGGFQWLPRGDGSFTINFEQGRNGAHHISPLDKYMMGLIEGSAVPTLYAYSDASLPPGLHNGIPVSPDEIATTVTINDIQALHGVRTPGPTWAQRDFQIGFVAESYNRLLNPTEMTYYEILAAHFTQSVPPGDPDPYIGYNWAPITRFFGVETTWQSKLPPHSGLAPLAAFSGNPTNGTGPLTVAFTDASEGHITAWFWDFGDGNTSTSASPSHTYDQPGTYTVSLTASGPDGSDTEVKTDCIRVDDPVPSSFWWAAEDGDTSLPFRAYHKTPGSNDKYIAQPQNSSVHSGGRASYQFQISEAGTYMIKTIINASTEASNSFFVNIDAEPEEAMRWHIEVSNGFEERIVSWRGGPAQVFALSAGWHKVIVRGREANAQLDSIGVVPCDPAMATNVADRSPALSLSNPPQAATALYGNMPNPFNPQTTIRYNLAEGSNVQVIIYNVLGQAVRTLVSEYLGAGIHQVMWDGKDSYQRDVGSGMYLVRMVTTNAVQTHKMLLVR